MLPSSGQHPNDRLVLGQKDAQHQLNVSINPSDSNLMEMSDISLLDG